MALKVGDLYVSLTANTQKLQGQLNGAAKQVEQFGRKLKSLGKDASDMSNIVVGAMAAVFAAASSKDAKNLEVKKQLEDLKTQSVALASEIAQAAMPMFQQMTDFVGRLITAVQQLTPTQRELLVSFLQGALAVSAIGMAAAKLEPAFKLGASAISFAGTAMSALGTAIAWVEGALAALGLSFLPVLAGIVAFIFIAGFVRQAWAENLGGIQEKVASVWKWITEKAHFVYVALHGIASDIGEAFKSVFTFVADKFSSFVKSIIRGAAMAANALGLDSLVDVGALEKAALAFVDSAPGAFSGAAGALKDGIVDGVKLIADGAITAVQFSGAGLSKIADDVKAKLSGAFSGFGLPSAAKLPEDAKKQEKEQKEKRAAPVKVDYGRLRADKIEASFVALAGVGGNLRDSLEMAGALNVPKELEQFGGDALKSVKGIEDVRDLLHKLGASAGETEKYLGEWQKWQEKLKKDAAVVERLRADRAPVATQQFLAGGTFGDSARMAGVKTGVPEWLEKLNGSKLKSLSDFEDLEDALAQIKDLNPVVKEFFERSKQTFLDGIEKAKQQAEEQAKKAAEVAQAQSAAVSGIQDRVIGAMGKVGGIIQAATGPLAQALGPIGALIGIIVELVAGSEGFAKLVAALDGIFQGLSDALGQLLVPVATVVNAIQPIAQALGVLVSQLLPLINAVLEPLLPIFVILGVLLMALSPIIDIIVNVLEVALIPAMGLLDVVMKALFGAIQTIAYIILAYAVMYGEIWNGIIWAVQAVLNFLATIEIAGSKPFSFLSDWATSLESSKVATDEYRAQMDGVASMTWDSAMTTAKSFDEAGAAADQLAAGMTNAASGFKVDLARFNATSAGPALGAPMEGTGAGYYGDTYVTIVSNDPEVIWEKVEGVRRKKNFQSGRGLLGGLPGYSG